MGKCHGHEKILFWGFSELFTDEAEIDINENYIDMGFKVTAKKGDATDNPKETQIK